MVMIPERLLQSLETEHRLNAPPQLPTLTRLDQDMQRILDSSLPEDQKILLLSYLVSRYRGLAKQMKSETKSTQAVFVAPPLPPTVLDRNALVSPEEKSTPKIKPAMTPSIVPDGLATPIKSKIPVPVPTPSQPAPNGAAPTPSFLDTPTSTPKRGKLHKKKTPMVARLRSNKKWMPY